MNWKNIQNSTIEDYINDANYKVSDKYKTDFLDVPETISELSYLTHDYFRYYGKFPSKIAKYIIDTLAKGGSTTMVEAKIAGFASAGIDINPFGVLAANVKTYNYDVDLLRDITSTLFMKIKSVDTADGQMNFLVAEDLSRMDFQGIEDINKRIYFEFPDVDKWFDEDVIRQLSIINS